MVDRILKASKAAVDQIKCYNWVAYKDLGERYFDDSIFGCWGFCCCFLRRSAHTHQFYSLRQDQSTVALQAEMTG